MPVCHLTSEWVERLQRSSPARRICYFDVELKGFMLELRPTGTATWYFRYKTADKKFRMIRIGSLKSTDALEARCRAYDVWRIVQRGHADRLHDMYGKSKLFSRFVEKCYMPHAKIRKRSWRKDEQLLNSFILPTLGNRNMAKISRVDILDWQNGLLTQHKLSASSCNRILSLLKSVFNHAVTLDFLDATPCAGVQPFKVGKFRERYLSEEETRRLLRVLDQQKDVALANAIRLLLLTGARKNEIFAARWEHVDLERRMLTVPLSKSGRARHIPLSDEAVSVLKGIPRTDSPWIFPSKRTDGHMSLVFRTWESIRKQAGLSNLRIHDLRHSFASFLVNKGRSLYEVQNILGHHDPKVTMRYAHLSHASLVEAVNIVGENLISS